MKKRKIIQIEYSQEEYQQYLKDRESLLSQGYTINDYSVVGFVLCEMVVDEREINDWRINKKHDI